MKPRKEYKPGQRVITPDGPAEVFETSKFLPVVSVFLDGDRKARYYGKDEIRAGLLDFRKG